MESINTDNVFVEFCCKAKEWIGEGTGFEGRCFCFFNFYSFKFIMRKQPGSDVLEQMMKMGPCA